MRTYKALISMAVIGLMTLAANQAKANLIANIDASTGSVNIKTDDGAATTFYGYELTAPANSFDTTKFTPVGHGFSAVPSASDLSEFGFSSVSLPANSSFDLGPVYVGPTNASPTDFTFSWIDSSLTYNQSYVTLSGTSPAPEPASLALLGMGGLTLLSRRRRA